MSKFTNVVFLKDRILQQTTINTLDFFGKLTIEKLSQEENGLFTQKVEVLENGLVI
jgi:hypothetical protein